MVNRWVKKGARQTKGWKRTGRKRRWHHLGDGRMVRITQPARMRVPVMRSLISTGIGNSPFPEKLKAKMITYGSYTSGDVTATQYFSWLANSFGDGTTGNNGVGPKVNFAGVFGLNYPTGLRSFLSTPVVTGSNSPYAQYRITSSKLMYHISPRSIAAQEASVPVLSVTAISAAEGSYAGMAFANFSEQPTAKTHYVSTGYFGTATTTAVTGGGQTLATAPNKFHTISQVTANALGVPSLEYDLGDFTGSYDAIPTYPTYFHLGVYGDGTNHMAFDLDWKLIHIVEFTNRNQLLSNVNQ